MSRIVVLAVVFVSMVACGQSRGELEKRIDDLEKRLARVEKQLGIPSPTTQAPPNPAPIVREPVSAPKRSASATTSSRTAPQANSGLPIAVRLLEKSFQEKGPGEESDRLSFTFLFDNVGTEHVTSFSGEVVVKGPDGRPLKTFSFDIAKYVVVGQGTRWFTSIPFRATDPTLRELYRTDVQDLVVELRLKEVMYYDTRVEKFY